MARIAPGWMAMLNTAHSSARKPSSSVARIKWPVEETGRYSVMPSTMPRMMTSRRTDTLCLSGRLIFLAGREAAAFAVAAKPFGGDRAERGGRHPECLEAGSLAASHIVGLKHQPLVAG